MAEKEVLFEDNMETQAKDFNDLQDHLGNSIDHIVTDAIASGNYYTGLTISKAASTQVSVAIGRLYWGGLVYVMEDPVIIDFQSIPGAMPVTQQRQIAIVAWGSTIQDDVQPRNFVVDADTGQAQPQSVSMTQIRFCNVGPIPGVEAASPNPPAIPATNLLVGYVKLDPTGVINIQQSTGTQLPNLVALASTVSGILAWEGVVNGQISTLQTSLAALAAKLQNYVTLDMFSKLTDLVNQIWQIVNRPPAFALDTIDNFFDESQSAVGTNVDGAYAATVQEGIRFKAGATGTATLTLLNSFEPTIQTYEHFVLPKPSGTRIRMDCSFSNFPHIAERILAHPYWTWAPRYLNWARDRFRCGVPYLPCPTPAIWTWVGYFDPIYCNLRFPWDVWPGVPCNTVIKYPEDSWDWPRYKQFRNLYYWYDYVDVFYWSKVYTNLSYAHNHFGQSFLNAQDGWISGGTIYSMIPDYFQPFIWNWYRCDKDGIPDHQQCIARIELDAAGIQLCYGTVFYAGDFVPYVYTGKTGGFSGSDFQAQLDARTTAANLAAMGYTILDVDITYGTWVVTYGYAFYGAYYVAVYPLRINFTPMYVEAGKRYSFHSLSTFDHQFSICDQFACYNTHCGDFWEYDGSYWFRVMPGGPRSLRFMLHYLTWGQWGQRTSPAGRLRYDIDLQPLQLAGGIQAIDVLAEHVIPDATELTYGVQVSGKWMGFAGDPDHPTLSSNPALLPFRVSFIGTTDLMPGVSFQNSQVSLQGPPSNTFHHISNTITRLSGTVTGIKVLANVTNYTSGHHTLNCSLHYGSTHKLPDGTVPVSSTLLSDGVTTQFTFNFNSTAVTTYQVELDGTTDGVGSNFVVSQRSAFSA